MNALGNVLLTASIEQAEQDIGKLERMLRGMITSITKWVEDNLFAVIVTIILAILLYVIGKKVINWTLKLTRHALDRSNIEEGVSGFICALVKATLYFFLIIIIFGMLGLDTSSLVALISSAGLSIGLALKGTFGNFAGGLMILLTKYNNISSTNINENM